jgi:PAS domain S-box-containing protein
MKGTPTDVARSGEIGIFERLDEVIVRVTTWVAGIFFVLLVVSGSLGGDSQHLLEALNPLGPAIVGAWMLWRGSPRAIVQLVVGGIAVAVTTGVFEIGSRSGALLGLVSMGIVGALLVRRHVVVFIAGVGGWLYFVAFWWNAGDWSSRQRVVESLPPALAFLFAAGLVAWLKRELLDEGHRRHEVADALAASEKRFRTAFETAAATMALISVEDGRFLRVNRAGCQMLGYSEEQLRGMTTIDVTHPDDREASSLRIASVLAGEVDKSQAAVRIIKGDGTVAHGIVSTALVTDAAGTPLHYVAHMVDTTEQHQAEQRLMDLIASRDELIASVSHELRTPLTAVLGYAEILLEAVPGTPAGHGLMLQEIVNQGSDLVAIIEDLLVFAQSDANTLKVSPVPLDLRDQVTLVLESLKGEISVDHITISGPRVSALADPVRVRQVLRNLLSNASRYGGDAINVEFEQIGSEVSVSVSDDGNGIPPHDRERVFEPYQRSQPRDGLTAAIGVGLTVARRLARLMDGDLTYEYRGGLSRFELSLPESRVPADKMLSRP